MFPSDPSLIVNVRKAEVHAARMTDRLWPHGDEWPFCLRSTYSVEKHKIDGDLIFLPRALSTLDVHPVCA